MGMMDWTEEKTISNTTIQTLDRLCEKFADLKGRADALEDQAKSFRDMANEISAEIMALLTESKKTSWQTPIGNFILSNRFTVPTPKDPEQKQAFFSYLKQKGIFEDLVSVHSQTLNAWYRQELDAALDKGDVNFKVPGLEDPKYVQTLSIRKK